MCEDWRICAVYRERERGKIPRLHQNYDPGNGNVRWAWKLLETVVLKGVAKILEDSKEEKTGGH